MRRQAADFPHTVAVGGNDGVVTIDSSDAAVAAADADAAAPAYPQAPADRPPAGSKLWHSYACASDGLQLRNELHSLPKHR